MKANVTAKGYTNVILVLNLRRFVHHEDRIRFERIRGTQEFADILRDHWPERALASGRFETIVQGKQHRDPNDEMSTEEIGFATGIFRSQTIEEYIFPTYALNKDKYEFPRYLKGNYQFKNLFLEAWKNWRIFMRLSHTGLFVIRLTRSYNKATPLTDMTHDVLRLQESLDVQSAWNRLEEIRIKYANQPEKLAENETSVLRFLEWLGADASAPSRLLYAPVQWKLAMEVGNIFVEAIGSSIPVKGEPIRLILPEPKLSNPLHDSYVIYHHDGIWANRRFVDSEPEEPASDMPMKGPIKLAPDEVQPVRPRHIRRSLDLQQQIASLIEGALFKRGKNGRAPGQAGTDDRSAENRNKFAPRFEPDVAKSLTDTDAATWQDELCLLTPRAALIVPSQNLREHELLIATLPGSTSRFDYIRYWGAVERMVEFVIEIQVLARLLERKSFTMLEQLAEIMDEIRGYLFLGDIRIHDRLPELIKDATHLRRLTSLCQALGDPHFWARAEYATGKAGFLMEKLGLPPMMDQIERNIVSINSVVDHVDEWYMADLAEQSNDMSTLLSLGLAAASFILTILVLPSFWADLSNQTVVQNGGFKSLITGVGTTLAIILIVVGSWLTWLLVRYGGQILKIMDRSLIRLRRTFERKNT